jgi:membrane fusion protein, multidrug efflux system
MRNAAFFLVIAILAALGGVGGWYWWTEWRFIESTDDAYVHADTSVISPKIDGYIEQVRVRDNQSVAAGDVMFVIDDRDFAAKVAQAEAVVATAEATVATFANRLDFQQSMIGQAEAAVTAAEVDLERARLDRRRYAALASSDFASRQRFESADADSRKAEAALDKARAALSAERNQLAVLQSQKGEEEARLAQARASLVLARNDLDNTVIRAPFAGVVGNRAARVGQYVKPGTQLAALVPLPHVHVTANFKETQLTHMRPGQPAEIAVDAYPGERVTGTIESFSPASGAQFSLLPPDNATGNFTKIVQRVPVRITLPADAPLVRKLRPGLSVTVSVDTRREPHAGTAASSAAARVGTSGR